MLEFVQEVYLSGIKKSQGGNSSGSKCYLLHMEEKGRRWKPSGAVQHVVVVLNAIILKGIHIITAKEILIAIHTLGSDLQTELLH